MALIAPGMRTEKMRSLRPLRCTALVALRKYSCGRRRSMHWSTLEGRVLRDGKTGEEGKAHLVALELLV
jgi:hypothetical protein